MASRMPGLTELCSLSITISNTQADRPGTLLPVLQSFGKYGLNITHMTSKLHQYSFGDAVFEIDFEGSVCNENTQACMRDLRDMSFVSKVAHTPAAIVPWFPTSLKELDDARNTLDGGTALISDDHPGFHDELYKQRRNSIVTAAKEHRQGLSIPTVDYTEDEHKTWTSVFDRLQGPDSVGDKYACEDYKTAMRRFNKHGILTRDRIPQLNEVSEILHGYTGFQCRPVSGLLSARDFLNALAFRIFWSTQYIRHHSNPFYTPEPDVCHELIGHVPLFAHPDFADFSQTIGLASLGATDEQIDRLATLYWFTVEFGMVGNAEDGYKAYGAGILSSFGEMEWACADKPSAECKAMGGLHSYEAFKDLDRPEHLPMVAEVTSTTAFPITTYQPKYFVSPTLADAKREVIRFCDSLQRPFFCRYDPFSQRIKVTRSIDRDCATSTSDMQAEKQADYFADLKLVERQ